MILPSQLKDNFIMKGLIVMLLETILESTPVAAIGGIPSSGFGTAPSTGYITQYRKNDKTGYGFSPDILSDNILSNGFGKTIRLTKTKKLLEGANFRIYKVKGDTSHIYEGLTKLALEKTEVPSTCIYEICTGKKLLSDDQLRYDPLLEEFDPLLEEAKTAALCNTLMEQYKELIETNIPSIPVMTPREVNEVSILLNGADYVTVYDSMKGYYAKNDITGYRTGYYQEIAKIPVFLVL